MNKTPGDEYTFLHSKKKYKETNLSYPVLDPLAWAEICDVEQARHDFATPCHFATPVK